MDNVFYLNDYSNSILLTKIKKEELLILFNPIKIIFLI